MTPLHGPAGDDTLATPRTPWWLRAHRAFMPDYNRAAAAYWYTALVIGVLIQVTVLRQLLAMPASDQLVVLAGVAMAMVAGLFPIRIPRWKNSFTAGEIFIFLLLLLHGPAAATLAAAAEGFLGSWRTSKRWTSRLATPAMASIAMYGIGSLHSGGLAALAAHGLINPGVTLLATLASALLYFMLNALLTTAVFHLKRSAWPDAKQLASQFGWIGITQAVSASIACLLFISFQQSGLGVLLAAAPIIGLLLVTLHYYFRQQEVDEAARQERLDAAERESLQAAAHVRELRVSEQRFHSAFSHASIGMALVSFDARVLQANAALCALLGHADDSALLGMPLGQLVEADDAARLVAQVIRLKDGAGSTFTEEFRLRHGNGDERWAAVHGSRFAEVEADAPCLILQLQDVTARRKAEAGLQFLAFRDSLTGLPNRHRFQEVLSAALEGACAGTAKPFGLMFMDFDRFKLINDSLGHAVGDEFLIAVSQRIQQQLRAGDVVARLGGDEFAVIAVDLDTERYAVTLADRLLEALRRPFHIAGTDLNSSVSIGITFSGNGYTSTSDMLRDADTAMYKAKANGKARYALFDAALHTEVAGRVRMENDLRKALETGDVTVDYQPVFELASGRITGFEALARWQHPELGTISPSTFVPAAEEAGLMVPLTDFVLRTACRRLACWQRRGAAFAGLNLHVNLSGVDVAHPNLVGRVNTALVQAGLQPHNLTLELTENTLMKRLEGALPALTALRQLGIGLCVDDFGTGYSSLRHLSSLPVSGLKIAPGFVTDLERGSNENVIVHAIVLIADSLGKSIIAEGIETAEQLERLQVAGCKAGQGYFLSRPLTAEQVDLLITKLIAQAEHPSVAHRDTAYSLFR